MNETKLLYKNTCKKLELKEESYDIEKITIQVLEAIIQELVDNQQSIESLDTRKEQSKVWLTLCIAHNSINSNEMQNKEKIVEEQNKVLKEKYERCIIELMMNNV